MRGRAGTYEHFSPVTGMKAGWILASRMASSRIACNIFHFTSIPFNCSDTALKVGKAMIVTKFIIFCSPCLLRFSNFAPELVPRIFGLFHLGNRAEISDVNTRRNRSLHPGQPSQPGSCEEALSLLLFIHHIPLHRISKKRHSTSACSLLHSRF